MAELLRRHGLLITWVVLFSITFQLMSMSIANREIPRFGARLVESLLFPAEKAYHEISESAKYLWNHYIWLLEVETERNLLLERIKELESLNSRLMESESENQRLRRLLSFGERTSYRGVVASVVARDPSNWVKTVTIDRGSADGIRPGLAVVDGNAIVGQTTVVTEHSSKVLLLIDASSGIDAILQSSRRSGVIEGSGKNEVVYLKFVEKLKDSAVDPGDRVIASGLDGVYPKGTLIGVVERVDATNSSLFLSIEVRPSVDFRRLENVTVILPGVGPASGTVEDIYGPPPGTAVEAGAADAGTSAAGGTDAGRVDAETGVDSAQPPRGDAAGSTTAPGQPPTAGAAEAPTVGSAPAAASAADGEPQPAKAAPRAASPAASPAPQRPQANRQAAE